MLKLSVLGAALLLPAAAFAQSSQGPYVSAGVGANFAGSMLSSQGVTRVDANAGPVGLAALGWRLGDGFRVEVEGSYRSNGVNDVLTRRTSGLMEPLSGVSGGVGTYAVTANIAYDLPVRPFGLQPYIGGGIGYGWLDLDSVHGLGNGTLYLRNHNSYTGPLSVNFSDGQALAYQAIAGVAFPVRGVRGLELTAEYRFFGTARAGAPITRTALGGVLVNGATPTVVSGNRLEAQDDVVMLGARYSFGRP